MHGGDLRGANLFEAELHIATIVTCHCVRSHDGLCTVRVGEDEASEPSREGDFALASGG